MPYLGNSSLNYLELIADVFTMNVRTSEVRSRTVIPKARSYDDASPGSAWRVTASFGSCYHINTFGMIILRVYMKIVPSILAKC